LFLSHLTSRDLEIYNKENDKDYETVQEWIDDYANSLSSEAKYIAFSHLGFNGAKNGSEVDMPYGRELHIPMNIIEHDSVELIMNGHFHTPQECGKIICPGTIENLRFGEGTERHYYRLEI